MTDEEIVFGDLKDVCNPCRRVRRRDACPKCGGPRNQAPHYCPCSPPPYLVQVIVLDEGSDRERTIYRSLLSRHPRWVSVANQHYLYPREGPLVITLPTKSWIRTRR